MEDSFAKVMSLAAFIVLGHLLRRFNILKNQAFAAISALVMNVTLPCVILTNLNGVRIEGDMLLIAGLGFLTNIIFLVWGIADVLRVQLPGVLARRLESSSEEARRLWQRLLGVLELIVGGGQLLFYFFSDNQTVTSIILAVMILAAVCILGPYYHWRKQEKENTQE